VYYLFTHCEDAQEGVPRGCIAVMLTARTDSRLQFLSSGFLCCHIRLLVVTVLETCFLLCMIALFYRGTSRIYQADDTSTTSSTLNFLMDRCVSF
jgi:hypothetical protein